MHRVSRLALMLLFVLGLARAQKSPPTGTMPEHYSVTAVPRGFASTFSQNIRGFDIYIDSFTPDGELQDLVNISNTQGMPGLEKAFSKIKARGRLGSGLGNLKFIRINTSGNEKVIRMATNELGSLSDRANLPALRSYPFAVIEFHLDSQGRGAGTLMYAVKLKFNGQGEFEIDSYDQPIELSRVLQH